MGLHTELEIYRVGYDLLTVAIDAIRNMPRDVKQAIGEPIRDECVGVMLQIRRANMATDKEPHLLGLLERLEVVELLARVSRDRRFLPTGHYARLIEHTQSVGKQANAWRRRQPQQQQRLQLDPQGGQDRALV